MGESVTDTFSRKSDGGSHCTFYRLSLKTGEDSRKAGNPFLLPTDEEILVKREQDAAISKQEKAFVRSLPVHKKTTILSRLRCRPALLRSMREDTISETEKSKRDRKPWAAVRNKGRYQTEETVKDYLMKQREAFLVQYPLTVKRENIHKLQKDIETQRLRIYRVKKRLQDDAIAFERFVSESEENAKEAVQQAEKETMVNMEITARVKKATAQKMKLKSEISKYQDKLEEYKTYKTFLMAVAPPQWHEEQNQKKEQRRKGRMKERNLTFLSSNTKAAGKCDPKMIKSTKVKRLNKCSGRQSTNQERQGSAIAVENEPMDSDFSDSDEEPALYFSNPKELLNVLTEEEEQNLFCNQNLQDTEEAMAEIQKTVKQTQEKMKNKIQLLQQQIEIMESTTRREKEKASELELKTKIFCCGEYRADKQEHMLNLLQKKVKDVYRAVVGDQVSNISTLDMLANIENKAMNILDSLETMAPEKVDFVQSKRDKERKMKMLEEKARLKKRHQEERCKLLMERATADISKRIGRKLMPRSEPLGNKNKDKTHAMVTNEQQDHLYFFT